MYGVIRVATPADAFDVARVHVATWRAAYAGLVPAEVLAALSVPAAAAKWEGHLEDAATRTWVADAGGTVTAFASAGPSRDADTPEAGEVYAVYVYPGAQRAGTGRSLLGTALAWLAPREATLWVLTANAAARAFYEACGFRPDGAARGIDVGGAVVDEVRYRTVSWYP